MENIIHVDFTRRHRQETHQQNVKDDDLLEEVVTTYLIEHPDKGREEARSMITQGLMFQQSLVEEAL